MENKFDKAVALIGKIVFSLVITTIVIVGFIHVTGPGADRWFAEHPVIHFVYRMCHIISRT